jgi:hypothetical protein
MMSALQTMSALRMMPSVPIYTHGKLLFATGPLRYFGAAHLPQPQTHRRMSYGPAFTRGNVLFAKGPPKDVYPHQEVPWTHPESSKKNNYEVEQKEIVIENLRGKEESATLDTVGFQLFRRPTQFGTLNKVEDNLKGAYSSECADIIKEFTGATQVACFAQRESSATSMSLIFCSLSTQP